MGCAKSLAENNFGGTLDGETMSVIGKWEFPAVCFCMIFSVIKKISDKMPVKERKSFLNGFDDVLIRNARGK